MAGNTQHLKNISSTETYLRKQKEKQKQKFYHERIIEAHTDSAKTWKILNTSIGKINNKNEVASFFLILMVLKQMTEIL